MARKFYAVQVGDDFSSDNGSTRKREAFAMGRMMAKEYPNKEVRIAVCTTEDDFCMEEIIVQEGER